jgi:hypothetical protein
METLHGFDFFPLTFDQDGRLTSQDEWNRLKARATAVGDVMFIAHGFRNDERDAKTLYTEVLKNLRAHLASGDEFQALRARTPIVAGVFWPSKSFSEAEAPPEGGVQSAGSDDERARVRRELEALEAIVEDPADRARLREAIGLVDRLQGVDVQDQFVDLVLGTVRESQTDATEGLQRLKAQAGSELLSKLTIPLILPTDRVEDGDGGVAITGFGLPAESTVGGGAMGFGSLVGSVFGPVGKFLNLTTWYLMKERSGTVGANGVAACVRQLKALQPAPRVHLVGHSLGGRLVVSCAKSLSAAPPCKFDSLIMLQAAFSHFGLSTDNGKGVRGFFRDVMERQVVTGPMVATFSFQDGTVGQVYSIASRLAGDNVKEVGDRNDPYGGIGRNGALRLAAAEFTEQRLHKPGATYTFTPRILHCLDGSGGLIKDHHDVYNPDVTYAIAAAMAQS